MGNNMPVRMPFSSSDGETSWRSGGWVSEESEPSTNQRNRDREQALDAPQFAWPTADSQIQDHAQGTFDDAASSPNARQVYRNLRLQRGPRHPNIDTTTEVAWPSTLPGREQETADLGRNLVDHGENVAFVSTGQAGADYPDLEDGPATPTPIRQLGPPRQSPRILVGEMGLVSPSTPMGATTASASSPWVSVYQMRSSLEMPPHQDASLETSSASQSWSRFDVGTEPQSSTACLIQSRARTTRSRGSTASSLGSNREDEEESRSRQIGTRRQHMPSSHDIRPSRHTESHQRQANASSYLQSPPTKTKKINGGPTNPQDMRALRVFLDNVSFPDSAEANTISAIVREPAPRMPRAASPFRDSMRLYTWSDVPLDDPPIQRAPTHSQPLSAPALARQRRISLVCLAFCLLCPPLLYLYETSRLDWVAVWWTEGETPGMRQEDKENALLWFLGIYGLLALLAVILFLTIYEARRGQDKLRYQCGRRQRDYPVAVEGRKRG